MEYMARAHNAGVIMGARVPVVHTNWAYGAMAHVASCALAVLLAHRRRSRA